ncbi:hypothetical protein JB92DRAFT_2832161 [Gautieria morchelliformis]|nr:hypothetical protein JB92DRAFT_2832161 [Gautieria morchelliformis]
MLRLRVVTPDPYAGTVASSRLGDSMGYTRAKARRRGVSRRMKQTKHGHAMNRASETRVRRGDEARRRGSATQERGRREAGDDSHERGRDARRDADCHARAWDGKAVGYERGRGCGVRWGPGGQAGDIWTGKMNAGGTPRRERAVGRRRHSSEKRTFI